MEKLMKLFKPTLVALALVAVVGCNEKAVEAEPKAPVLDTEVQKQAYGLGASIGMYMQRNLEEHDKLGLALDKELIVRGFVDSIEGKAVIEKEEIQALLMNLDATMKEKQAAAAIASSEASLAEGAKFLAENAKLEGVTVTESGIQYSVLTAGEGDMPAATDTVKVHYVGTFLNGDTFDSSRDRGEPAVFPLNRVIKGWTEGVQLMPVGAKYKFTIPSDLAYGPNGNPPSIPGNSVLQFEIELLEIQKADEAPKADHDHAAH
jgi:FKBP-type peptidyl-prolyl cis-trans isomerase FkpA